MSVRAFFAVDIDEKQITKKLMEIQENLEVKKAKINFVMPQNFHFTLEFLGDIEEDLIPKLKQAAEEIEFEPFELEIEGLGALPNFNYIRVIYADVTTGMTKLSLLAEKIKKLCVQFNLRRDKRDFTAHLTIGRVKWINKREELVVKIREYMNEYFGKMTVNAFKLKKSVRTPEGPIYSDLFTVKAKK
jgi:2'-5' RNA ligase